MRKDKNYLINNLEELDEEEFDKIYNKLDVYDRDEVDDAIREFADQAIGDEHWDSDE
ncbi:MULTISPECIES: hypothetical protein [Lactobacillales]|uniref:hypothetical protein n=1 Tax=Lactobacillales TaxID=186826 RepID=UPI0016607CD1|nr:hypothetical protein [Desemzia incerta]GMR70826.1 hypothetical protein NUITMVRA1_15030 [Aerococcus viridans]